LVIREGICDIYKTLVFCRPLIVLILSVFFWLLYCLSFFELRFLITPLTSSNFLNKRFENWNQIILLLQEINSKHFLYCSWLLTVHSTYANILKNMYKKVRKYVGIDAMYCLYIVIHVTQWWVGQYNMSVKLHMWPASCSDNNFSETLIEWACWLAVKSVRQSLVRNDIFQKEVTNTVCKEMKPCFFLKIIHRN